MTLTKKKLALAVAMSLSAPFSAYATNGMNLEGYGPIATGMGGASMAYDNGTAAVMNNPATLGLMEEGNRVDVALGFLGPDVKASMGGMETKSSADAFWMPAVGWARKDGHMTYGVGVFAQGGMGTEYNGSSFLSLSGKTVRSEVSVGRFIVPIVHEVNKNINVGASLDYVWGGMDLQMDIPGMNPSGMTVPSFQDFVGPSLGGTNTFGRATGSLVDSFGAAFTGGALTGFNFARFDFSNSSKFTGEANGSGFAGKLGGTFKINDQLTLGTTYHSKTSMGDWDTDKAKMVANVSGPATGGAATDVTLDGKISVRDFQWPQMFGFGAAFQVNENLMLVADYKWINWKDTMKDFKMTFTANSTQSDPNANAFALGGKSMDVTMFQDWDDQNVIMLGGAYKFTDVFTLRAGANLADNPIPDKFANPLFPAIVKNHYMIGGGFNIDKTSAVNASITYAPEVKVTSGSGVDISHSQTNWQLMYSARF